MVGAELHHRRKNVPLAQYSKKICVLDIYLQLLNHCNVMYALFGRYALF